MPYDRATLNQIAEARPPSCLCSLPHRRQRTRFTLARSISWIARPSRTAFVMWMASTKYSDAVLLINLPHLSQEHLPDEGLRARGFRGDPLGEARDCTL